MARTNGLRKLADKYRALAEVGHSGEKEWRLRHAEYLDRLAEEAAAAPPPARRRAAAS